LEYVFRDLFIQKISAAYSYLNLDKKAVGFDSRYALDYLKHKAVLTINHKIWNKLNASWKASYQDRSGTYDANTIKGNASITTTYKPYFMLDGRLLWSQKRFDIFADANNIFNTAYDDFGGLVQPGFNFNVGVRYKL
jgi:iron complex outermembrane receptor protein